MPPPGLVYVLMISWTILEILTDSLFSEGCLKVMMAGPVTSHRWNPESWFFGNSKIHISQMKKPPIEKVFFYDFLGVRFLFKGLFYWLGGVFFLWFGETNTSQILPQPSSPSSLLFIHLFFFPDSAFPDVAWVPGRCRDYHRLWMVKNRPSIGYQFHDDFIEIRPGSSVHSTSVR